MQELYQGLGSKALPSAAIAESRRPSLIGTKISRRIASAKRKKAAGACEVGSGDWTHLILRSRSQLPTSASLCSQWQTPVPTRNVSEDLYNMLPSAHSQLSARSISSLGHRIRSRSASSTFAFWTVAGLLSFVPTCIAALCTGFFHIAGWRRSSESSSSLCFIRLPADGCPVLPLELGRQVCGSLTSRTTKGTITRSDLSGRCGLTADRDSACNEVQIF